jgi:DNA-directed RNA polymerase I subunit RPA12
MIQPHSLVFCSTCGTLLDPPLGLEETVVCFACSKKTDSKVFESIQVMSTLDIKSRSVLLEKKENGATIKEKCPKCDAPEMVFHTAQLRSADEGQTIFYNCIKCGYKTSINS